MQIPAVLFDSYFKRYIVIEEHFKLGQVNLFDKKNVNVNLSKLKGLGHSFDAIKTFERYSINLQETSTKATTTTIYFDPTNENQATNNK